MFHHTSGMMEGHVISPQIRRFYLVDETQFQKWIITSPPVEPRKFSRWRMRPLRNAFRWAIEIEARHVSLMKAMICRTEASRWSSSVPYRTWFCIAVELQVFWKKRSKFEEKSRHSGTIVSKSMHCEVEILQKNNFKHIQITNEATILSNQPIFNFCSKETI